MGKELGLVGRHVDVDRAFALAALAGEAEVERLLDGLIAPASLDRTAAHHLEQQVGPSPGRVLLLVQYHVAGAHGARIQLPALSDADTTHRGARETPFVIREGELRLRLPGFEVQSELEIGIQGQWIDDLPGVHLSVRIPDRLELAERLDQFRSVHPHEQLAAGLPVAMFAGVAPAEADDHVGCLLDEVAIVIEPMPGLYFEVDSRVNDTLAEMTVQGAIVPELIEECPEVAEVIADPVRRHGRVFPAGPGVGHPRHPGGRAETGFPCLPELSLRFLPLIDRDVPALRFAVEVPHESVRQFTRFVERLSAEFDHQVAMPLGQKVDLLTHDTPATEVFDEEVIEPFDRQRFVLAHERNMVARLGDVLEAEDDQHPFGRPVDQFQLGFEVGYARRFRPRERPRDVEPPFRQEVVQVVAGDAPRDLRIALADERFIPVTQVPQPAIDFRSRPISGDNRVQFVLTGRADPKALTAVGEHLERDQVIGGPRARAVELRVHGVNATRVVGDHPPEGVPRMGRGIGSEGQPVRSGGVAERIEDGAGQNTRSPTVRIDPDHRVQVLREIHDDGRVHRLPGERRASAPRGDRHPELAAGGDRLHDILDRPGDDHADRRKPVVGRVVGVEAAISVIETYLPLDAFP